MKKIRNILFGTLFFSLVVFSFMQTSVSSKLTIDLESLFSINQALASPKPPCWDWGYKTWGHPESQLNGVDCDCHERGDVWDTCH